MNELRRAAEALVYAWQALASSLWSNRMLAGNLTFNEINVCSFLKRHADVDVTATELCEATGLQKSQMNRVISELEARGYLRRERSTKDRRLVFLRMQPEGNTAYQCEREAIMGTVEQLVMSLGQDNAIMTAEMVQELARLLRTMPQQKG